MGVVIWPQKGCSNPPDPLLGELKRVPLEELKQARWTTLQNDQFKECELDNLERRKAQENLGFLQILPGALFICQHCVSSHAT